MSIHKINYFCVLTKVSPYYIRYSMNNKEIAYQKTLDYVFKHRCHYCGCTPKNDEWANRQLAMENPNVCIDCQTDLE